MQQEQSDISLRGQNEFITEQNDAYHVVRGCVDVYVRTYNNPNNHKPVSIYEAQKGDVIPSFVINDDYNHVSWRFQMKAHSSEADLSIIPNGTTKRLQSVFLRRAEIPEKGGSFQNSVVEFHNLKTAQEHAAPDRARNSRENAAQQNVTLISEGFHDQKGSETIDANTEGNELYRTIRFLCSVQEIPLAETSEIMAKNNEIDIEDISRASHFSYREIKLEDKWQQNDHGAFLAFTADDRPIACVPRRNGGYKAFYPSSKKIEILSEETAQTINSRAYILYSPFPDKSMQFKDFFQFGLRKIRRFDVLMMTILALVGTLISALIPMLNQKIYDDYIPLGSGSLLIQICSVIGSFMIGNIAFSVVKNLYSFRASSRLANEIQSATYDRIFRLPERFFRKFESADLAGRAMSAGQFASVLITTILTTTVTTAFSLVYLFRMFTYSAKLTWFAFAAIGVYSGLIYSISVRSSRYEREISETDSRANSLLNQLISGVEKIQMAGAENWSIKSYLSHFMKSRRLEMKKGRWSFAGEALTGVIASIFSMIFYYLIIRKNMGLSAGNFIAFNAAFGMFASAMISLVGGVATINSIRPLYERYAPILKETPEFFNAQEKIPTDFKGNISIKRLKFAYTDGGDAVINDITLQINAGKYIGIVGPSGCGKSTLLKLLLGFELPQSGKIEFDGADSATMDKQALRSRFGVVLQDGALFSGSIYENITITNPRVSISEVMDIVRAVGLETDINDMPMGLQTIIDENGSTISGGQKQRILIARALVNKPQIILMDEATSALDNITQAHVCQTISKLSNCTRLIIAHRISTIQHCDMIVVMNEGRIVEQGTYNDLLQLKGMFYDLAVRQSV